MNDEEPRLPFWAKCLECSHIWIAAYTPMMLVRMAQVLKDSRCPMCGADSLRTTPASQSDGKLRGADAIQFRSQGTSEMPSK